MSSPKTVWLLVLLLTAPFLALGQKIVNSELATEVINLASKTFILGQQAETTKAENELQLLFLFYKDGRATFRTKKGNTIIKDNPISWRLTGDSLYLQPSAISLEADGKRQLIKREPMKYLMVKAPGGYLLKGKDDQMLLIEQK